MTYRKTGAISFAVPQGTRSRVGRAADHRAMKRYVKPIKMAPRDNADLIGKKPRTLNVADKPRAQHRRLDHSSECYAFLLHHAHRPHQGGPRREARGLRHGRRRHSQGRGAHGGAAAGGEFVRGDDLAKPCAVFYRQRLRTSGSWGVSVGSLFHFKPGAQCCLLAPSAISLDVLCLVAIGGKADEGQAGQNRCS
jgi:hypothetical protein